MLPYLLRLPVLSLVLAAVLAVPARPLWADDGHDHDRARRALEAGEVMPLRGIIERVEREQAGQIIEIELEQDDGRWQYELKLLRNDGNMLRVKVDARDGRVLSVRGRRGSAPHGTEGAR
ncbi:PepSY domain-containing protein [Azoarcus sp. L1K30]|uniref:PepSY domain-containing protein n=1 Tax=Azoarcus sp. L1K30 TaxID=2820277 RepID=UPI001B830F2F|nr:PepSY domain-containing protein [Azoarcus sp. L1K30]MBR0568855.1 PepSY domain-containing protein [Azoarcus sp. L1K30]